MVPLNRPIIFHVVLLTLSFLVSPYLKSLSMVAANKLLHLLEASTICNLSDI